MAKSTLVAGCGIEFFDNLQACLIDALDHHLGNPITTANGDGLFAKIDNSNLHLTSVVGIDGTR